jgi:hypothetical protein
MILTVLVLSGMLSVHAGAAEVSNAQVPCLPPGISPEFLSWPSHKVIPKTEAEVIPGDTIMYRDTRTGAKVLIVKVNGIITVVDPTPEAQLIDFWVRVFRGEGESDRQTTSRCQWQRSRERAA